jgi:phosphoribosylformylglycinamidine synthase
VALAESCISGGCGAEITIPSAPSLRLDEQLFAEGGCRIVVSVAASDRSDWEEYLCRHLPHNWHWLGVVTGDHDPLWLLDAGEHLLLAASWLDMNRAYSEP